MIEGLKELGPSGAFISLMSTAILGLSGAVALQWKHANKVYGYRLAERDTLKDALNGNTKALADMTRATEDRNRATEELAEAIDKLAQAFERMNDRLMMQHDVMKEQGKDQASAIKDQVEVISSLADAMRVNTGMLTEVRNALSLNLGPPRGPSRPRRRSS